MMKAAAIYAFYRDAEKMSRMPADDARLYMA